MWTPGQPYKIILWYRYVPIADVEKLIECLKGKCESLGLLGRVLLSVEGMNGTLAGAEEDVDCFINFLSDNLGFQHIDWKHHMETSHCAVLPFLQLSVRQVKEIISCGPQRQFIDDHIRFDAEGYGGIEGTGTHLSPIEFHDMLQSDNCVVLDIRNDFEYDIGHFETARPIGTFQYAETFQALDATLSEEMKSTNEPKCEENAKAKDRNILMYCTGGIRCEKASAYLRAKGLNNVFQLQGGIHRYLEAFPDGGKFLGKNFVFDSRVAVSGVDAVTATQHDESLLLGGSSVVVGRCIDCCSPHDAYSGFIVCTVCRMPVLVCEQCVASNPHLGEFYCSRHRDLKGIYCTILDRFDTLELESQKAALQQMLERCLQLSEAEHSKQSRRTAIEITSAVENTSVEPITHSKRRRQTLRKQIARIDEQLLKRQSGVPADGSQSVNPKVKDGWGFWRN